eukprot:6203503-Pleurochrysis_carterae.AAC.1
MWGLAFTALGGYFAVDRKRTVSKFSARLLRANTCVCASVLADGTCLSCSRVDLQVDTLNVTSHNTQLKSQLKRLNEVSAPSRRTCDELGHKRREATPSHARLTHRMRVALAPDEFAS